MRDILRLSGATRCFVSSGGVNRVQPFESIPGPRALPLIGNVWRYLPLIGDYKPDTLYENAQYNRKRYGPIVREQITNDHLILHLFDPIDIKSLIKQDSPTPYRRSHRALLKYRKSRPNLYRDGGLFPENGQSWIRLRKLFQLRDISSRARIIDRVILETMTEIESRLNLNETSLIGDFDELIYKWALRSSLALLLDYNDVDELPDETTLMELIQHLHNVLEAIDWTEIKSDKWNKHPTKCPYFKKLSKAESYLYNFIQTRINQLIGSSHTKREVSFLRKWLLEDKLDQRDVIAFIIDSILAGLHTTAYSTIFLLDYIAKSSPEVKGKLKSEIGEILSETPVEHDISGQLTFLKDCLKESLRLNPVSIGTGRLTQSEMVIRGYRIPQNTMVIAHSQVICRDPDIYEDPDVFAPQRWATYRSSPRANNLALAAWRPFGFGPRICIGQSLAGLQIVQFAARMIQNYEIQLANHIKTKTRLIHTIDGHVEARFRRLTAD